jgi:hypothetical protein
VAVRGAVRLPGQERGRGLALSRELAELDYDVDYYVHIDTKDDAVKLVTHMPYQGATVRGLPVLNQDKAWDRVRQVGLDELLQFDWTLVGESDALSHDLGSVAALDEIDLPGLEARLRRIRGVIGERRRYLEILA